MKTEGTVFILAFFIGETGWQSEGVSSPDFIH